LPLSALFFSLLEASNNFYFFYFFLSIILLAIGTYTDFRERIISNKLTYSMIFFGIALHAIHSYLLNDYSIIIIAAIVTIATFVGAYFFWKLGVWAGGDVKAFTALAALNPVNYAFLGKFFGINSELLSSIEFPIFPLTLFIFSIFAMLPYGALLGVNGLRTKKELRQKIFGDFKAKAFQSVKFSGAIIGLSQALQLMNLTQLLLLPLIIILGLIRGKIQLVIAILLFLFGVFSGGINALIQFILLLAFFMVFYAILKLFSLSRSEVLKKEAKIGELEEGMIPAFSYYEAEGEIKRIGPLQMGKLLKYIRSNNLALLLESLNPKGRQIISHRKAAGLSMEEIGELKKLAEEKRIEQSIAVKLSAPMIPAVFIAFIALSFVGDLLWNILF